MPKPILLAIDDDISVLEAVVQDLRRNYGQNYRIIRAASGQAALDICRQLQERKETVALFLSDQRMPGMTGVDFLQQAMVMFPDAKRVLRRLLGLDPKGAPLDRDETRTLASWHRAARRSPACSPPVRPARSGVISPSTAAD